MSEKTYYSDSGKGDQRRVEDRKAVASNWDKIDWSKKLTNEEKLEAFEKNKVTNFKASTLLEKFKDSGGIVNNSGVAVSSETIPVED